MTAALLCSLTLPVDMRKDNDPDTSEDISAKSDAGAGAGAGAGEKEMEMEREDGLWSSLQFLFSVPLCCLFLASMGSFFLQRGLSDWAGELNESSS